MVAVRQGIRHRSRRPLNASGTSPGGSDEQHRRHPHHPVRPARAADPQGRVAPHRRRARCLRGRTHRPAGAADRRRRRGRTRPHPHLSGPSVELPSSVEPVETTPVRKVSLDDFFAAEYDGDDQRLEVAPARPSTVRLTRRGRLVVLGLGLAATHRPRARGRLGLHRERPPRADPHGHRPARPDPVGHLVPRGRRRRRPVDDEPPRGDQPPRLRLPPGRPAPPRPAVIGGCSLVSRVSFSSVECPSRRSSEVETTTPPPMNFRPAASTPARRSRGRREAA